MARHWSLRKSRDTHSDETIRKRSAPICWCDISTETCWCGWAGRLTATPKKPNRPVFEIDEQVKEPDAQEHVQVEQIAEADDEEVDVERVRNAEATPKDARGGDAKVVNGLKVEHLVEHVDGWDETRR